MTINITGHAAREIDQHVRAYVHRHAGNWWTEVQSMNECRHGCKLYVRKRGAVRQYILIHSTSYGCVLGSNADTRTVKVSIRPKAS